jgi:hypothetical protein
VETALHVLGGTTTHHQELKQLYLQHLVFVTPLLLPAAIAAGSSKPVSQQNRWRGKFVLHRPSSETQSISVAMERWSVEHRVFAVETIFKNKIPFIVTQLIFRRHFNIHRNECP